jgi:pimeloyl-ACP methyl ester carboxylesterase
MTDKTNNERKLSPKYDNKGNASWDTRMSAPDNSVAVVNMIPDRIIPVIFLPGVMGSNLIEKGKERSKAVKWLLDGPTTAAEWAYATKTAAFRKRHLNPAVMEVDTGGALADGTPLPAEELRRRGWGEVGAMSYAPFLVWLENTLNDFDQAKTGERAQLISQALGALKGEEALVKDAVALSYRYRFPVHACGYNWLASNAKSAERLGKRIDDIIARYRAEKKKCEKVILVTHSMGGLVARHCSQALGHQDKILGIVHGVMPAIGAAAVYRRFKAGTEDTTAWYNAAGAIAASALGNDAAEMTAVLSSAPGPLQLLPTPEYGNGWLKVKDGAAEYSLPKSGDPYGEIYAVRGKWWSMCEDELINPLNEERDPKKRQAQMDRDWEAYADLVDGQVEPFHRMISGKYHPNSHAFFGSHDDQRAYGNVTWAGDGGGWMRGDRRADVLEAKPTSLDQINETRKVDAQLDGTGWVKTERQKYKISDPDERGDGTVPHRSGIAPKDHVKSLMQVNAGHEPAYREGVDVQRIRRFTLRAIVQIAQEVTNTGLRYE